MVKAKVKTTERVLKNKLQKFKKLKEVKYLYEAEVTKVQEKLNPLEKEIYDEMLALGYKRVSTLGFTFFPTARIFFSFGDRAKGLKWIKKNHPGLMTVNAATLTSFFKDFVEKGKKVPSCFKRYSNEKVGMRKN